LIFYSMLVFPFHLVFFRLGFEPLLVSLADPALISTTGELVPLICIGTMLCACPPSLPEASDFFPQTPSGSPPSFTVVTVSFPTLYGGRLSSLLSFQVSPFLSFFRLDGLVLFCVPFVFPQIFAVRAVFPLFSVLPDTKTTTPPSFSSLLDDDAPPGGSMRRT